MPIGLNAMATALPVGPDPCLRTAVIHAGNNISGGSNPGDRVHPSAVAARAAIGIDISEAVPQKWSNEEVEAADVVVTMGCGDECPYYPGTRYEDWVIEDPHGQGVEAVRPIRDEIQGRVEELLSELVSS